MSGGHQRSEYGIQSRRVYHRARQRARAQVARLHREDYLAAFQVEVANIEPNTPEYWRAQARAYQHVVSIHRADYEWCIQEQLEREGPPA